MLLALQASVVSITVGVFFSVITSLSGYLGFVYNLSVKQTPIVSDRHG